MTKQTTKQQLEQEKLKWAIELQKIEVDKARRQLLPKDEVAHAVAQLLFGLKAKMVQLPPRLSRKTAQVSNKRKLETIIKKEIDEILNQCATFDLGFEEEDTDSTGTVDDDPVGGQIQVSTE